jgi:hypothetical protein
VGIRSRWLCSKVAMRTNILFLSNCWNILPSQESQTMRKLEPQWAVDKHIPKPVNFIA